MDAPPPPAPALPPEGELSIADAVALGVHLLRSGQVRAAASVYQQILAVAPAHVDALHFLGIACHQTGQSEEAVALIRRALELAPAHADAHNNLGNVLKELGRLDEAEACYRRALDAAPQHADALNNVACLLVRRRALVEAEAMFRLILTFAPAHVAAHHNLGALLQRTDREEEALLVFKQALLTTPHDGQTYQLLGGAFYGLGRIAEAAEIYARWLQIEPRSAVAQHLLAACTGAEVPSRASDDFVKQAFDVFADSFDDVLAWLDYRGPGLVAAAVGRAAGAPRADLDVLDAGCGTGLCGVELRPWARRLCGVDLSARMIQRAQGRRVYDQLTAGELTAFLEASPASFDVVVSADTLIYFGDLAPVLNAAAVALRPGGLLVFTLEQAEDGAAAGAGFCIGPHGRYSHHEAYVRRCLQQSGLEITSIEAAQIRTEMKRPVMGPLVTARRAAGGAT